MKTIHKIEKIAPN